MEVIKQVSTGNIVWREEPHGPTTLTEAAKHTGINEADLYVADIQQSEWDSHIEPSKVPLSMDDFEARFTTQEWDSAYDYVYEVDTTTGLHKRKALVQGWNRAMSRNYVDLLHAKTVAFMDALVAGGVITEQRKTAILTP